MSIANGTVKFLKTFKSWAFAKKDGFSEKILNFSEIADGNKFAAQCERISKVPQNVHFFGFGSNNENFGFLRETEVY